MKNVFKKINTLQKVLAIHLRQQMAVVASSLRDGGDGVQA